MEKKGKQLQPLGICHRLYNFLTNSFYTHAFKCVTLGCATGRVSVQKPVSSTSQSEPDHVSPFANPMKRIDNILVSSPGNEIDVEFGQSRREDSLTRAIVLGGLAHGKEGNAIEGSQSQLQDTVEQSIPQKPNEPKKEGDLDHKAVSQEAKTQDNASKEAVIPSAPKKTVSINDKAEEIDIPKKKRKISKGKMKQDTEADKDETSMKPPRPLKPILKVTSNINEKSEAFIRRRKESLRSYSSTESRSYF